MRNLSFIYEIRCEAADLPSISLELKDKREVFFHAGSFIFEKNYFFGFLLPIETGFWLVFYGQPKLDYVVSKPAAAKDLNESLVNCKVTELVIPNSKGQEKAFATTSLSGIQKLFKKLGKGQLSITPVCGDDKLAFSTWLAAFHRQQTPIMPWSQIKYSPDISTEVKSIVKECFNTELSPILERLQTLEESRPLLVPEGAIVERKEEMLSSLSVAPKRLESLRLELSAALSRIEELETSVNVKIPASFRFSAEDPRVESCVAWLYSLNARVAKLEKECASIVNWIAVSPLKPEPKSGSGEELLVQLSSLESEGVTESSQKSAETPQKFLPSEKSEPRNSSTSKRKKEQDPSLSRISISQFLKKDIYPFLRDLSNYYRLEGPVSLSDFFGSTLLKPRNFAFEIRHLHYITYEGGLKASHVRPLLKSFIDEHIIKSPKTETEITALIPDLLVSIERAKKTK